MYLSKFCSTIHHYCRWAPYWKHYLTFLKVHFCHIISSSVSRSYYFNSKNLKFLHFSHKVFTASELQGRGISRNFISYAASRVIFIAAASWNGMRNTWQLTCWNYFALLFWCLQLPMLRKISIDTCDAKEGDFDLPSVSPISLDIDFLQHVKVWMKY